MVIAWLSAQEKVIKKEQKISAAHVEEENSLIKAERSLLRDEL